ncbi:hypothetical protein F5877DRAFT_73483 [Lentinula edodes]|nr:hypothetical protein F5877DRAFT_73483 [Lentinula edodes]
MVDLPANSSFVLNITEDTPSLKRIGRTSEQISKKYTRDSGIALSDDDEDMEFVESSTSSERLSTMPRASTSVSSLYSDIEDGLVTPGVGPRSSSAWPDFVIVNGPNDGGCDARFAKSTYEAKKAPGTPVKKSKVSYLARQRPWQSAMTHKVGFGAHVEEKMKKVPRKSMPASFPPDTDSESDCDDSPSNRKEKHIGLGIDIPSLSKNGVSRNRWLMLRSSSGAFSSSSESAGTPTRNRPLGDQKYRAPRSSTRTRRLSQPSHQRRPGRFEQQFAEIAEVGSGEFGKVKDGNSDACFAVKKSKRFEGVKHRYVVTPGRDAWEEDEQLFIWTELCEGGNFAHFLWEYGRVFPRLDLFSRNHAKASQTMTQHPPLLLRTSSSISAVDRQRRTHILEIIPILKKLSLERRLQKNYDIERANEAQQEKTMLFIEKKAPAKGSPSASLITITEDKWNDIRTTPAIFERDKQ